jgi:hypothetical protein
MGVLELNWPSFAPRFLFRCKSCPLCSSIEFNSAEFGPMDAIMHLFTLKPVRCVNCFRRYYCWSSTKTIR